MTRSHTFSRASRQLHEFWLVQYSLYLFVVIGQSSVITFVLVLQHLIKNCPILIKAGAFQLLYKNGKWSWEKNLKEFDERTSSYRARVSSDYVGLLKKRRWLHIEKKFNFQRTGLVHQHCRCFFVLERQYGYGEVKWKRFIPQTSTQQSLMIIGKHKAI